MQIEEAGRPGAPRHEHRTRRPFASRRDLPWLALTAIGGLVIELSATDVVPLLATGDSGRDLYAFWRTAEGDAPYRDFYWNYGPLMPYYFAAFLRALGTTIESVLIAAAVLQIACGLAVHGVLRMLVAPAFASAGALWFLASDPGFYYTWNHPGAVLAALVALGLVLRQLDRPGTRSGRALLPVLVCAVGVKLNAGLATLAATLISLAAIAWWSGAPARRVARAWLVLAVGTPLVALACIVPFTFGLPVDYLLQCFPYAPGYDMPGEPVADVLARLGRFVVTRFTDRTAFRPGASPYLSGAPNGLLVALVLASLGVLAFARRSSLPDVWLRRAVAILVAFFVLSLHEFLVSGLIHRLSWGTPILTVLCFVAIGRAGERVPRSVTAVVLAALFTAVGVDARARHRYAEDLRGQPERRLPMTAAGVFVGNEPD